MQFRNQIPAALRHRFDSLGGFVNSVLEEKRIDEDRVLKQHREFIQIVVFITVLHRFLVQGAQAAKDTLEELKKHEIKSFAIGGAVFEEGSEELERGFVLARALLDSIRDPHVKAWVESEKPLAQIVDDLYRYVRRS